MPTATHLATTLTANADLPISFAADDASEAANKTFNFDLLSGATTASATDGTLIQQVKVKVINPTALLGPQAGSMLTLADGTELGGNAIIPDDAIVPLKLTQQFPRLYLRDTSEENAFYVVRLQTQRRKHQQRLLRQLTPILVNRKWRCFGRLHLQQHQPCCRCP